MNRLLIALALLGLACARPIAHIDAFVGRGIQAFITDSALQPTLVRQEPDGATYVFEVVDVVSTPVPPSGPARPQNIENQPAPIQMGPANANWHAFEGPRVAPGTPEPVALRQAPQARVRYLKVRTDPGGVIRSYGCSRSLN
jgi:hypothetical protein